MIRTFIGLELDNPCREALARETDRLRRNAPKVRWVRPENLHLTLAFIGAVPTADLGELFQAVDGVAGSSAPFSLELIGLGCYPDLRRPRIVWAGCGEGREPLIRLAGAVQDALARLGYPRERRAYSPHLTMGRVKRPRDAEAALPLIQESEDTEYGLVDIQSVVVFMSELKRSGAEYSPMHHALLQG